MSNKTILSWMGAIAFAAVGAAGLPSEAMSGGEQSISSLTFFEGNWNCDGLNFATPESPSHHFVGRFSIYRVLDSRWMVLEYDEDTSQEHPMARRNIEYWGVTPDGGRYLSYFMNSMGLSGQLESAGWEGDAITWAGSLSAPGGAVPFKGLIRRTGEHSFHLSPSAQAPDGTYHPIAELECSTPSG